MRSTGSPHCQYLHTDHNLARIQSYGIAYVLWPGGCPLRSVKAPLAPNIACLDYSAGYGGPLVAYRFDGERILSPDKFVAVE